MTPRYDDAITVREAREQHFAQGGFTEAQYTARFARFRLGPLSFWVPNSSGRTRALPYHDVHHVLTEYDTSWKGEAEIAAWELAAGCREHPAAGMINLGAMPMGMVVAPRATFRAFVRGRQSRSLYGQPLDDVLPSPVGSIRERVGLTHPSRDASLTDVLLFLLTTLTGLMLVSAPLLVLLTIIWLL